MQIEQVRSLVDRWGGLVPGHYAIIVGRWAQAQELAHMFSYAMAERGFRGDTRRDYVEAYGRIIHFWSEQDIERRIMGLELRGWMLYGNVRVHPRLQDLLNSRLRNGIRSEEERYMFHSHAQDERDMGEADIRRNRTRREGWELDTRLAAQVGLRRNIYRSEGASGVAGERVGAQDEGEVATVP